MTHLIRLVNPPGAAVERPSIGLGIIKSLLTSAGYAVRINYENLKYAEFIGLDLYNMLLTTDPKLGILDWIFGGAAFPDTSADYPGFICLVLKSHPEMQTLLTLETLQQLRRESHNFNLEAVARAVEDDPVLIGCSSSFCQHVASLALLRGVRMALPHVATVMGGANCEAEMGRTTQELFDWVDFVVSGDAEEIIVPLVRHIVSGKQARGTACDIDGVFSRYRPAFGIGDKAHARAKVRNMTEVPRPDYRDYFSQLAGVEFRERVMPGLPIEASRGCWWGQQNHCTFCGLNGGAMSFSSKPPDHVMNEMSALSKEYSITRFGFVDNILDYRFLKSLIPSLASTNHEFEIFFEVKSNLKRDQVQLLAKAGVRWLQPGIESLDSRILHLMRKGASAWQNILLLKWCRQFGIRIFWNLIHGTPGEQDYWYGEQAKLIPLISHFEPALPVQLQYCRFSPYVERPADFGLALAATAAYKLIYPLPPEKLDGLVYFFDDVSIDNQHSSPHASSPDLLRFCSSVIQWRAEWRKDSRPTCRRVLVGGKYYVIDTRTCATERVIPLDACAFAILEACEEAPLQTEALKRLGELEKFTSAEIETTLEMTQERGFVLAVDGRLISVVHLGTVSHLPVAEEFPGGYVKE